MSAAETDKVQRKQVMPSEVMIVLFGKTGVGKSSSGNTILGKKAFRPKLFSYSVVSDCEKFKENIYGRIVSVVDTPGNVLNTKFKEKLELCISLCAPGPHVFLVVLQPGSFTEEDKEIVKNIKQIFGEESSKYTMVLFTHGDMLRNSIDEFICKHPDLLHFIQSCSRRYHVFNNEKKDPEQVKMLLEKIDQLITVNGGQHYTNPVQMPERAIQKEQISRIQRENQISDADRVKRKVESKSSYPKAALGLSMTFAAAAVIAIAVLRKGSP